MFARTLVMQLTQWLMIETSGWNENWWAPVPIRPHVSIFIDYHLACIPSHHCNNNTVKC